MAMLRRAVGEKVAFDLVATGRVLTAADAVALGLASRVIPGDGFEAEVDRIVGNLARSSSTALSLIKKQLYELDGRSFREGIELGANVNAVARSTPDFRAAVAAFLEKS